jgi:hypothetical protein
MHGKIPKLKVGWKYLPSNRVVGEKSVVEIIIKSK